jgi:hypothetical protein
MTHSGRVALIGAMMLGGCCFDGLNPPATVTPLPPPSSPGTGTGPLLPGGAQGGLGTPISFGPGTVDPVFAQGFGGGPIAGPTLDPSCYPGHYATAPSHILTLTAPLPFVRIMALSPRGTDLTMLVRLPNGTAQCVDDADGLNPMVDLTAPMPGEYQIYVGNYSQTTPEAYELGVTTNATTTSTSMHFAPSTTVASTGTPAVGSLLLTGTASVSSVTGSVPGVSVGTACTYTQTRVVATGGPGVLDCRWQVTCGGTDLYGGASAGGYQPCSDASWAAGTLAMDSATTTADSNATFLFSGTMMTIGDDASGAWGAFTVTLTTTAPPTTPMPMPMPTPTMPLVPQATS